MDEDIFSELASDFEYSLCYDSNRISAVRRRMSDNAAAVRDAVKIKETLKITLDELKSTGSGALSDTLLTQAAVLTAMSQPCTDPKKVQETVLGENGFELSFRDVRPIPDEDSFFENVWREYRNNKNVF